MIDFLLLFLKRYVNRIAKDIMDEQSPQRLLGVREKFYEVRERTRFYQLRRPKFTIS